VDSDSCHQHAWLGGCGLGDFILKHTVTSPIKAALFWDHHARVEENDQLVRSAQRRIIVEKGSL
jgi:hypothetical protein